MGRAYNKRPQSSTLGAFVAFEARAGVESADFSYLRERTGASAGNLSVQPDKLATAGYVAIEKGYKGKRPQTTCRLTDAGRDALTEYVEALRSYLPL